MTKIRKPLIILAHVFVGWALCTATMGTGMAVTSIENTLIVHAIGAPVFFAAISWVYFKRFNFTTPLQTAGIFVSFVILMDFLVVALLILGTLEMFASILGTWVPFTLIFASTYLVGLLVSRQE